MVRIGRLIPLANLVSDEWLEILAEGINVGIEMAGDIKNEKARFNVRHDLVSLLQRGIEIHRDLTYHQYMEIIRETKHEQ